MKKTVCVAAVLAFATFTVAAASSDDKTLLHIPGSSTQGYTRAQILSLFVAPDWWPQDHPTMPQIVAHGRGKA